MKKRLVLILMFVCSLMLIGCAKTKEREVFRFEAHQLDMTIGDEIELKLILGSVSSDEEIKYFTDKDGIIELNGNKVTALEEGIVKVTAQVVRIPTTKATVEITVSNPKLSGLKIVGENSVDVAKTLKLTIETNPSDISNDVVWSSSDPTIATVDKQGLVTTYKPGTVVISAQSVYDETLVAKKSIDVLYQATERLELEFIEGTEDVIMGTTSKIKATVYPEFANPSITWTTSDATKATVKDGVITPVKVTDGSVITITAKTVDGVTVTREIKVVYAKPEKVNVTTTVDPVEVFEEKTITLKATVEPANANQLVTWSSSDEEIATVSDKGVVTGLKKGTVTITATADDGTTVGTLEVNVTGRPDPETIVTKVSNKEVSEVTIEVECDETISVTVSPTDAKQDYEFTFVGEQFAEVEKNNRGLKVTGIEVGDVTITITSTVNPSVTKTIVVHIIPLEE